jgi:adenylate kinase family enzyme/GNAT superfamily N-acetyltransferase
VAQDKPVRTLVFGNSGSGKSSYAAALASAANVPRLELDMIVWEPNVIAVPRAQDAVRADLAAFVAAHSAWVIEGCDGDLIERALPACDELVFMNPGVETCLANNRRRPWEPHKYASAADQDRMLPSLLAWVEAYYDRTDARSYAHHRRIFDAFSGTKREVVVLESLEASFARRADAAQSILASPAADQARVLERALAECGAAAARAMAKLDPASGASVLEVAGGLAIFAGEGSPLTQGLAMGLRGPVTAADLDAMERHLTPRGHGEKQLEIGPFVDPSLTALLAERGYRVHEWQLTWVRALDDARPAPAAAPDPRLTVRRIRPGEEDAFLRAVMAGFLESEVVPADAIALMRPTAFAEGYELYLALLGDEPIGGGTLVTRGSVALVAGAGVRPAFRRHGAQGALLRARLDRARELGCTIACSSTLPGTASRRNMERHGFAVAYPKIVMLKA